MRQIIAFSKVKKVSDQTDYSVSDESDPKAISKYNVPKNVDVFEIEGPFFFGAAFKFKDSMRFIEIPPKVLIVRMRFVPMIDASGLNVLEEVYKQTTKQGTKFIISGIQPQVEQELSKHRLLFKIGKKNVVKNIEDALKRAEEIISQSNVSV
jgi:SulP family sulfate permease